MVEKGTEEKKRKALKYHEENRPGKIEVTATKPCITSRDLSLAYTPGVSYPCLAIHENENDVYKYTSKGNLVAVISNGTAVLGLGNIGPMASKPVMEGKGILFKRFADIDVFDIEINETNVDEIVKIVKALEPTFGGINLEDIKAPDCFDLEKKLIEELNIPVFHDDQHGTAIIASAAFINALEITKRDIKKVKVVFSGAGAAAMSCANLFIQLGVQRENLLMCDSKGVLYKGRTEGLNKYKEPFVVDTPHKTLAEAIKDADAFIGCSSAGVLKKEMVATMGKDPIIFAMANPTPEIFPEEVFEVRDDAIMATGRSDYANQVNNVLGFPFIFRGALDVRATKINEEMKLAAVYSLANLAKEPVPDSVKVSYGDQDFSFGKNYLIPKPFDKRVLLRMAPAVAKAAADSGVARTPISDLDIYAQELSARLGNTANFLRLLRERLKNTEPPTIVFPEGTGAKILKAVSIILEENLAKPILLGETKRIHKRMGELKLGHLIDEVEIKEPHANENLDSFAQKFYDKRKRKGVSLAYAKDLMAEENYFGPMMVEEDMCDGLITGAYKAYPECIRPIMQVSGTGNGHKACGVMILVLKSKIFFFADCTVQFDPTAEDLAHIAHDTAELYRFIMAKEPRVAFLSFSNFGSNNHPAAKKMSKALDLVKDLDPELICEGEIQADVAVNYELLEKVFGFNNLDKAADVLIFPDLNAANISYKLLVQLAEASPIGPILTPMKEAINIVQRTSSVDEIVNMVTITALQAQLRKTQDKK